MPQFIQPLLGMTRFRHIIARMGNPENSPLPFGMDRLSLRLDKQDPYLSLHFVMVFVRDQERSLRFYLDQLGFRLIVDQRVGGFRWVEVAPPDGSANLALVQAQADSVAELVGATRASISSPKIFRPSMKNGAAVGCVSSLRRANRNGAESSRDSRIRMETRLAWPASMS